ncbi:MAG: hypothetical protein KJ041_02795 [Gammaproteobacteria bacterium]|nr:hypothetical protein [Gammaproteobacteria bacterium]
MSPARLAAARFAVLGLALAAVARAAEPVSAPPSSVEPRTVAAAAASPGGASLNLDATAIRGNQELPKVLYIVPWKDPAMVDLAGRPVNSLVEEVLAPVDREVFRRQTRYFGQLFAPGSGRTPADGPAGPAATGAGQQ